MPALIPSHGIEGSDTLRYGKCIGESRYTVTDENGYFELTLNTEHFTCISSIGIKPG